MSRATHPEAPARQDERPPTTRWSDYFTQVGAGLRGIPQAKTTQADTQVWEGSFEGHLLCVHSTVRLTGGNMAHFLVHSGARIGSHAWNLRGGHYVDLRILSRDVFTPEELRRLGRLAQTEDTRSFVVRQGKQTLSQGCASRLRLRTEREKGSHMAPFPKTPGEPILPGSPGPFRTLKMPRTTPAHGLHGRSHKGRQACFASRSTSPPPLEGQTPESHVSAARVG